MKGQVPKDIAEETGLVSQRLAAALDELEEQVFGGPEGRNRAAPLLARWDREVGVATAIDEGFETLQAARVDWALCDAAVPGGGPGETWAWRAAMGAVPGVVPTPLVRLLAGTQVGLFEVWPGRPLVLRDRLHGLCVRVDAAAPWLGEARRPVALWEVRLAFEPGGVRLCRPPIEYPLAIAPLLQRAHEEHFRAPERIDLQRLRGQRLRWARARKAEDPRRFFAL
ncbi:MAG TPA: hypothetical protein VIK91_04770 [Nannocystis sp.]